ncbi:MAG: thioredoxin family protein [Gemmataceae bacterium]
MNAFVIRSGLLCALACLLTCGRTVAEPPAEKADAKQKKAPLYDPTVDARVQLDAAVAKAKRDHSRVLVMFGFEGCVWCHRLHALLASDAALRAVIKAEYVEVLVDIKAPHADAVLKECKAALSPDELDKGVGYPFLAVLDGNGKVLTAQRTDPLEEGKGHNPKRVKEFLDKWVAPRADAQAILDAALAAADKDGKQVFIHFGAPSCGWCHRLDNFLAREDIAALLGPDFVDVKIDISRMDHGKDVLATYRKGDAGGIPWFVIVDAKGKAVVTSDGPKGNIGYPYEPHEIDQFLVILKQSARKLEPAQMDQIEAALRKTRDDIERERKRP